MLTIDAHPLLDARVLLATWPESLGRLASPPWMDAICRADADTPFDDSDEVLDGPHKRAVRDLLRHGGFKPAGRNKPCWEYMRGVARKGAFPRINPVVDATNAAALHGALPVSTVDRDRLSGDLRIGVAEVGSSYVFNRSGQELDLSGLLCLFDDRGPCANSVKDAQRSKTDETSTRTLTVVWGTTALPGRSDAVADWQAELFDRLGARVERLSG